MRILAVGCCLLVLVLQKAESQDSGSLPVQSMGRTQVLTLGTFHFSFPNLDVRKIEAGDQIDVLDPQYQKEIEDIVGRLARFKPTIIAIERPRDKQAHYDSLYNDYLQGRYQLSRSEDNQIGFRLAQLMGIKSLHCIDSWGRDYEDAAKVFADKGSPEYKKFVGYFTANPDSSKRFLPRFIFKTKGIRAELLRLNEANNIRKDLGNYLIGVFKYETPDNDYFGPDFVSGWWFDRNLRIFRNLQRIGATPADRIVVIFGAGHMNLLNMLLEASPEYELVHPNEYLK